MPRAVPLATGLAVLVAVARAGVVENPGPPGFPLDDAWIHLVYGKGLLANGFLAYEDGVPSTGATSPLWAVVLAAVHAIVPQASGVDGIVRTVWTLGILLQLAAVAAAGSLARRFSGKGPLAEPAAGALVALAVPMSVAAFSGMEVGLASLLLLLGVGAAMDGKWIRSGALLALAGATRPESAAVVLLVALAAGRRGVRDVVRFLLPPVAVGGAFVAYDLWASGAPLPSAFYAKSSFTATVLPGRIARAVAGILGQVPPLGTGVAYLAIAGWWPALAGRRTRANVPGAMVAAAPGVAAVAFLVANLALIDPVDPEAFYHVRYLLPAVPLLLVSLTLGALRLGSALPPRARHVPVAVLVALSLLGAARGIVPASRHLHNDIRNINEVQRRIGEHLRDTLPEGTRIATSDAGGVRYFSGLPTTDVTGLNTPAMRRADDAYLSAHPAHALVLLPAWYRTPDAELLEEAFRASTDRYTVTSHAAMATQIVLRLRRDLPPVEGSPPGAARRVRFFGFKTFAVDLLP